MTVSDDLLRNYFVKLMKYAGAIIRVFSEKIIGFCNFMKLQNHLLMSKMHTSMRLNTYVPKNLVIRAVRPVFVHKPV